MSSSSHWDDKINENNVISQTDYGAAPSDEVDPKPVQQGDVENDSKIGDIYVENGSSYHENDANGNWSNAQWSFTDVGRVPPLSRDGSPNATDEVFNSGSHLAASMLSLLGTTLLVTGASAQGDPWKVVSFSLYGASLIFLFVCSTLHHAISATPTVEARLRLLDYLAIYPLIAGTFTPFCLVYLHKSVIGWSFFGVAWFLAFFGMYMTAYLGPERIPKWMSMTMYITLGWLGAFLAMWLIPLFGWSGLLIFILGGLWYTVGGYIYTAEKPNPIPGKFGFHEIWHVAVVLGAASHYAIMFFYVLPWQG